MAKQPWPLRRRPLQHRGCLHSWAFKVGHSGDNVGGGVSALANNDADNTAAAAAVGAQRSGQGRKRRRPMTRGYTAQLTSVHTLQKETAASLQTVIPMVHAIAASQQHQ